MAKKVVKKSKMKKYLMLLTGSLIFNSGFLFAENVQTEIGLSGGTYSYREFLNDHKHKIDKKYFMRMDGHHIYGLYAKQYIPIEFSGINWLTLRHSYDYKTGKTTYKGGYNGDETGALVVDRDKNHIFEGQWHFMVSPGFTAKYFNPYAGVGYRIKTDKSIKNLPGSYPRKSEYVSWQLGFETDVPISDLLALKLNVNQKILLRGKQTSDSGSKKDVHTQKRGNGSEISASLIIGESEVDKVKLSITPYFSIWNIADSSVNIKSQWYGCSWTKEPKNKTYETGIKVGVIF